MTTMDNRVGGGTRWGGYNVLTIVLYPLTIIVSALAHRAVPTTTGYHVTIHWTKPSYSQH
jgi:hypothetical protein